MADIQTKRINTYTPVETYASDDYVIMDGSENGTRIMLLSQLCDLIKKAKTPNTITFTGATQGTYDGTKAITINIPEGVDPNSVQSAVNSYLASNPPDAVVIDQELSTTSVHPVQNKVIADALSNKMGNLSFASTDTGLTITEASSYENGDSVAY